MTTTATAAQARIDSALDDSAEALHGAADAVREQASALIDRFRPKIDAVNHYARDEPTKAMLIAAAAGAALMALVAISATAATRRRSSGGLPEPLTLDSQGFASALRDLATRVPQAASAAVGSGKERASAAADSIANTLQSLKDQVRNQTGSAVDRIRPQVEAVTMFAKEEPVKLALGVILTGAAVAGIAALLRSLSDD